MRGLLSPLQDWVYFIGLAAALTGCKSEVPLDGTDTSSLESNVRSANIVGPNGSLSFVIPAGEYPAGMVVAVNDSRLISSNVISGTTIFGVVGSLVKESHGLCSASGQIGCVTGTQLVAGSPQGSFSGANGALTVPIPAGYYDGTKSVAAVDSNLVAGNIASGINILGVMGSAGLAPANCSSNGQINCVANASFVSASPVAVSFNGSNGLRVVTPAAGFYDGATKSVSATDTNLVAANIVSGKTIFGVTGSASPAALACVDNTLNSAACTTASNRYVTAVLGSSVSSIAGTGSAAISVGFHNGTKSCTFSDPSLIATNIRGGTSVLGVFGIAACTGSAPPISLNSNVARAVSATPITQAAETSTYAGASLPGGYREVPSILADDDGFESASNSSGDTKIVNRAAFANCGTTQSTIAARIAHCATVNGVNATWNGATSAGSGQGEWKLVTRSGIFMEVWQDQRTGLLWSSVVKNGDNWCRASGNAEESDPSGHCNAIAQQPSFPAAQSWCAESGPGEIKEVAGSAENWATGVYSPAKGGMGATSTATSPSVRWRLPTRNDYLLADVNGIRFVMPDMIRSGGVREWVATIVSNTPASAWYFSGSKGQLGESSRATLNSVRCVGR